MLTVSTSCMFSAAPGKQIFCFRHFFVCSQNCKKRLLDLSCLFIRPSVCMELLGSHWTEFLEIWYLKTFKKSVNKIQESWYKTYVFLEREHFQAKVVEENKTHILYSIKFSSEKYAFYAIIRKNILQPGRSQII
jgi:hypothetical protein